MENSTTAARMMKAPGINWIDFLLDESLLLPYLQTNPQSAIVELLNSFIDNVSANESPGVEDGGTGGGTREESLKVRLLKTLAFRTAASLNWNLDNFSKMSIGSQFLLMTYVNDAFGKKSVFCRTLYLRWMLKSRTFEQDPYNPPVLISSAALAVLYKDLIAIVSKLEGSASVESDIFSIPTFASVLPDWSLDPGMDYTMPVTHFLPILYYDLGCFALYSDVIGDHEAVEYFPKVDYLSTFGPVGSNPFFSISPVKLAGYFKLLGISEVTDAEKQKLKSLTTNCGRNEQKIVSCATPMEDYTLPVLPRKGIVEFNLTDAKFGLIEELKQTSDPVVMESIVRKIILNKEIPRGPISRFFSTDSIPNALNTAISQLEPGTFQDVLFIRVFNGLRLLEMKCFNKFRYSLEMALTSIRNRNEVGHSHRPKNRRSSALLTKLDSMISWEILRGDIHRAFLNWGGPEILCVDELVERCEGCIGIFQSSRSDVRPRPDVVEAALMALINLGKFELVVNCSKASHGWPFLEFLALLGRISINVQNEAFYSSNFRDMWNAVLPILSIDTGVHRQPRVDGIVANVSALKWVLERSKSRNLVKIFVSLLAKLHNFITQDDAGFIIEVDLLAQWPNFLDDVCEGPSTGFSSVRKVSGTSKLNLILIRELLVKFLETQGGPDQLIWLKTAGHVHLIAKCPHMAMKCYVDYFCRSTDCFESENSRSWNDDLLIHRMIRASYLLGSYLQATILCQLLTVPDYTTAFGMASEVSTTEAWVSLSEFIWDQTILEYIIKFYSKRKEYAYRLNAAINVIRQLELNSYNSEEIKAAAMRIRKVQFLRTLVSIYLID